MSFTCFPKKYQVRWCACLLFSHLLLGPQVRGALAITSAGAGGVQGNPGQTNTYGWAFSVGANNLQVTGLGIWDQGQDGLNGSHVVGIWNSDGNLVSSATVSAGTAAPLSGEFRIQSLSTPFILSAGSSYTIGALFQGDDNCHGPQAGPSTIAPQIMNVEGRFDSSGVFTEPNFVLQPGDPAYLGPNFEFNTVPEPQTWSLLLVTGIGLVLGRRYAR